MRALLVLIFACLAVNPLRAANKDRQVVLVTIDGFPARLWLDPNLPLPTLRQLAADGATADAMTVSNPSITWPCHTSLITGVTPQKHGVLFNGLLVRQPGGQPPKVEPKKGGPLRKDDEPRLSRSDERSLRWLASSHCGTPW